ncbi:hypothetical protein [uncultured Aquimarina sp.]|nr:hypothetical protein [uncultured Aquimarina sp.]
MDTREVCLLWIYNIIGKREYHRIDHRGYEIKDYRQKSDVKDTAVDL